MSLFLLCFEDDIIFENPMPMALGVSRSAKLLARWPRCRFFTWKIDLRCAGYVAYALTKDWKAAKERLNVTVMLLPADYQRKIYLFIYLLDWCLTRLTDLTLYAG